MQKHYFFEVVNKEDILLEYVLQENTISVFLLQNFMFNLMLFYGNIILICFSVYVFTQITS